MSSQSRASKRLILLAAAVAALLGIGWLFTGKPDDIRHASEVQNQMDEFRIRSSPGDTFSLSSLTSFDWSQVAIVSPASTEAEVLAMRDDFQLPERFLSASAHGPYLLFIDRRRVVAYAVDYANTFLYQNGTVFSRDARVVVAPDGSLRLEG